jgi:cytochrome c biogenesis protein CcdA
MMKDYKKLLKNTALAFLAGAVTAFTAIVTVTDSAGTTVHMPTDKAAWYAAGAAAIYAGARAAIGFLKLKVGKPISVDA